LARVASAHWDDAIGSAVQAAPRARRKAKVRRLTDAVIAAIILAASALCINFYFRSRAELSTALTRHQAAVERVEALNLKLEQLDRDVKRLRTDPRVIERFARARFGFVRPGDLVIRVTDESDSQTSFPRPSDSN
jgi:cell division protein FtsB